MTDKHSPAVPLVLAFGNLANAVRDEKSETHRFGVREHKLHEYLRSSGYDVFAASELRSCQSRDRSRIMSPVSIAERMAREGGLGLVDARPNNLDGMCFWRATLCSSRVVPLRSECRWAIPPVVGSTAVSDRGVMLLFTQFRAGHHTFWVINSHMPWASVDKLKTVDWLNQHAEAACLEWGDSDPVILYGGDQNTWPAQDSKEMMAKFATGWVHLSSNVKRTWSPYPHDVLQDPTDVTDLLDHIFVNARACSRIRLVEPAVAVDTGTSDHYFCLLKSYLSILVSLDEQAASGTLVSAW